MRYIYFIILILIPFNVHAYADPGSGAFIIQAIIAFLSTVLLYLYQPIKYVKDFFKKIFSFFSGKKNKVEPDNKK
tara:strand:- start:2345 stop:2569 length:225 start_codon:yes stop_codon:yes gene_type:complete